MRYTALQQSAIWAEGKNILVSAAAGSGKTAVLTERIIRHLSEKKINIDQLLIVTFTEAAAAEMRERIALKIAEKQSLEPGLYWARQAALLPGADISTIHSFCRKLVKENFQAVNIDPSFTIGDETELNLLKTQAMDEIFEEAYEKENNDDFIDLNDVYGGKTLDDRLEELVLGLYDFLESDPYPEQAAEQYALLFDLDENFTLDKTPWAAIAKEELAVELAGALEGIQLAKRICRMDNNPDGPAPVQYLPTLESDEILIKHLQSSLQKPFEELFAVFSTIHWTKIYGYRKTEEVSPSLKEWVKEIRDKDVKERIQRITKGVFFAGPDKMKGDIYKLRKRVKSLLELTIHFSKKYTEEKQARNVLDFSDLEHYAIQILFPGGPRDGTPGPIAEALGKKYKEVLIDEYQDSNSIQDLILSAAAGSGSRFMVGDAKQGIYRFRRANPRLFIDKYENYGNEMNIRIDLSQNFRSRREVIDTVNFFFSQLMCPRMGEINYDGQAALSPGAEYPGRMGEQFVQQTTSPVEQTTGPSYTVNSIENGFGRAENANVPTHFSAKNETDLKRIHYKTIIEIVDHTKPDPEEGDEAEEALPHIESEAKIIALRVKELLKNQLIWDAENNRYRPCRLNDIVILTRSISSIAQDLTEALKKYGIDAAADIRTGFYETPEIKTALAFLRVVDNPRQDIELITVLHSPVYRFSPDELLLIRQENQDKTADYYECLEAFALTDTEKIGLTDAGQKTLEKTLQFLKDLKRWREMAAYMPISRLIGVIYDDTRYPAYAQAMPGGDIRQANLRLLLERAIQFEQTSLQGLFHFVKFIERLNASGSSASAVSSLPSGTENRVRVMTIHKSKGLEFPIVFVSLLGRTVNREDERSQVVTHPAYGLGPYYVDLEKRVKSNTLARFSLARLIRRESLSEELRILYVAMTRAKEKLILTGCFSGDKINRWQLAAAGRDMVLPLYYRRGCAAYLDWLMPCLLRHRDGSFLNGLPAASTGELFNHPSSFLVQVYKINDLMNIVDDSCFMAEQEGGETEAVPVSSLSLKNLENIKPRLPSKISISDIKRLYASDISPDSAFLDKGLPVFEAPAFLRPEQGITPLQMGAALHTAAQHMDFNRHTDEASVNELIKELAEKNLMSGEEAAAINRNKIIQLANSSLAERIRKAPLVYREVPFVLSLPAYEIYRDESYKGLDADILVHGIIDCYFIEDGQIVLIDYKNDTVKTPPQEWAETHRLQLEIYKKAAEESTDMNVKELYVYSFYLGAAVALE